ncbi:MAG: WG repeat-containing protein [Rikenellaceae bacterium]
MRLTINLFKECLKRPASHLSILADVEILRDQCHDPAVWRTTNFAEAEVMFEGKRYIIGMPLTEEAHIHCLRKVTLMNKFNSVHLSYSEMLIDEMKFKNRRGEVVATDLLLHEIPEGSTLYEFAEYASRTKLLEAINRLEQEFKRLELVHNNLTPHNVIVDEQYNIYAIRYHYTEKASADKDCGEEFASLREWVNSTVNIDQEGREGEATTAETPRLSATLFSGYNHVSNPFEELVCVADDKGYMYVSCDNKVIIDGRFKWASDFHEGRAEVETESGMGLINKEGEYVISPIYDIVDYNFEYGLSRVRKGSQWALYDYMGEQVLPFEDRYIDDEDLEILSI